MIHVFDKFTLLVKLIGCMFYKFISLIFLFFKQVIIFIINIPNKIKINPFVIYNMWFFMIQKRKVQRDTDA